MGTIELLPSGAAMLFTPAACGGRCSAVLLVHGWATNIFKPGSTFCLIRQALSACGIHTLSLSFQGHECSKGDLQTVTRQNHFTDLEEAALWLFHHRDVDTNNLGVSASSYGAYITSGYLEQSEFRAVHLRAPALYPDKGWDDVPTSMLTDNPFVRKWRTKKHNFWECRALESLHDYYDEVQFAVSGDDLAIPEAVIESYWSAAERATTRERKDFPNAKHILEGADRAEYVSFVADWFSRKLM